MKRPTGKALYELLRPIAFAMAKLFTDLGAKRVG